MWQTVCARGITGVIPGRIPMGPVESEVGGNIVKPGELLAY